MQKLVLATCLSLLPIYGTAANNATINLPMTQQGSVEAPYYVAPLHALTEHQLYHVTCHINNKLNQNADMLFEPRLLTADAYAGVELNHQSIANNAGPLISGDNELSFNVLIDKKDLSQYNQFKLSSDTPIEVNSCIAAVSHPPKNNAKNQMTASATNTNIKSGFFYLTNNTNRMVTVSVGNFFPTPYTLGAYGIASVYVSTDNQNIYIDSVR